MEIEVIDDTPEAERKPPRQEAANEYGDDVTEEELQSYSQKVQKRIGQHGATLEPHKRKNLVHSLMYGSLVHNFCAPHLECS